MLVVIILFCRHSAGETFSSKVWAEEVIGMRDLLTKYSQIRDEDIRGFRAPFLSVSFGLSIEHIRLLYCNSSFVDWRGQHVYNVARYEFHLRLFNARYGE